MLRRIVMCSLAASVAAFLLSAAPVAAQHEGGGRQGKGAPKPGGERGGGKGRKSLPEFDPAAAGAVGALVAGGAVLLARRRKR
jgi:LPXTG-motif cell wall-anchored protein